ncbi:MAG: hypothetical protein QXS81_01265, partial [Candidatus Micrarchaeaceae archaeon]
MKLKVGRAIKKLIIETLAELLPIKYEAILLSILVIATGIMAIGIVKFIIVISILLLVYIILGLKFFDFDNTKTRRNYGIERGCIR